jgi:hypothetical protein
VAFYALLGGFGGWCGKELWTWRNASIIILTTVVMMCLGVFLDWSRSARCAGDFRLRGLLAVEVSYGIVGGILYGLVNFLPAVLTSSLVKALEDPWLRLAAGGVVGGLLGGLVAWSIASQRRENQQQRAAAGDSEEQQRITSHV